MSDVIVSGLGAVTAAGIGVEKYKQALFNGKSCIHDIEYTWKGQDNNIIFHGGKVRDFNFTDHFNKSAELLYDPFTAYALVAAKEAIEHSGIPLEEIMGTRTAVIFGTGLGGASTFDFTSYRIYKLHEKNVSPFSIPKIMPNAAASHICINYKINGPSFTIATACSSSTQAIGLGLSLIRSGLVDKAIVGGSEAMISSGVMRTWEVMRALSPTSIKPFSKNRDGTVLGEGAGILVLESEEYNTARSGPKLAKIIGFGTSTDGKDLVKPDVDGATYAIKAALKDANLEPAQIDYINAHGTGTQLNDLNETNAIKNVFGDHAYNLSISSSKPIVGHLLGGTGAVEAIATVLAMQNEFVPPTINYEEQDINCDLDVVPNIGKNKRVRHALSNSFAFGGINAVIALESI